jgi:ribosomal protein S6
MAKKTEETAPVEETIDAEHAELRAYELGFHIDPDLGGEEAKKVYQGLRSVAEAAGTVLAEGEPQKTTLAYTVSRMEHGGRRDFAASHFAWVAYETDGQGHEKVAEAARAESRVFRFIDIRTSKEGAKHSAELYAAMQEGAEKGGAPDGEEVSDAELDQALKEVEV